MCGRYTLTAKDTDKLTARFEARLDTLLAERAEAGEEHASSIGTGRFNVAPTQDVLTVVSDSEEEGRHAELMRWGLLPKWAKDPKISYKMINAVSETVREKPAYRGLIGKAHHRCLIVADGFYEWIKAEDPGQPRQPVRFTVDGGEPFAFAGLWTRAKPEGEAVTSCTILTTQPNEVVSRVHNRMPAILAGPEEEAAWLSADLDAADAVGLCRPIDPSRMQSAPANPALNKVGAAKEGPDLLVPSEVGEGG